MFFAGHPVWGLPAEFVNALTFRGWKAWAAGSAE
jgi:hypothetical protein